MGEDQSPRNGRHDSDSELDQSRVAWDTIATGYSEYVTPSHFRLGLEGLSRAGLRSGLQFLDVAAGPGSLSIPASRPGAHVLATDLSSEMLSELKQRAPSEGLATIRTRQMDGHFLDIEDDSFDVSGSQYGIMLLPDLPRAVRELVRVTKPGGRVLITAYGPPQKIEFLGVFIQALKQANPDFPGLPSDPPPHEFQVADSVVLASRLEEAGPGDVTVETVTEKLEFVPGDHFWNWIINSNPIERMLTSPLDAGQLSVLKASLSDQIQARAAETGVAILTNPTHIAVGTK